MIKHTQQENIMHFCMTAQYTPQALNKIMENPKTNRHEAAKKLIEAAGGKLLSMYSTAADGPGVLVIFDVPDPNAAPAISGTVVASGAIHNVHLTRLWTQDEIMLVRQKAVQLRASYTPPGG
ncbi:MULTISPECIES: GYD domain-containing protein [unclassified Bradyrhizobium]|uniref:GYD domain-containing protein n=1 Tax=unclassified Bradyrhizobium TaxID=2631580 RepID=UPI0020134EE1|nr:MULTISPECIES: GYD domain-containing protein [unclassified Bradyrhizobium]